MKEFKYHFRLIFLTTLLVVAFGGVSVSSWYVGIGEGDAGFNMIVFSKRSSANSQRNPSSQIQTRESLAAQSEHSLVESASIKNSFVSAKEFPKMTTLDLGCIEPDSVTELLQSTTRQIRLVGSICHLKGKEKALSSSGEGSRHKLDKSTVSSVRAPNREYKKGSEKLPPLSTDVTKWSHPLVSDSQIINTSNGFEGTLFLLESFSFTSDYLYLKKGLNKIKMEYTLTSGKKYFSEINIFNGDKTAFKE